MSDVEEKLRVMRREAEERETEQNAKKHGLPYLNLATAPTAIDALRIISEEEARSLNVAIFTVKNKKAGLAVFDPTTSGVKALMERLSKEGYTFKVFVVSFTGLKHAWEYYKFIHPDAPEVTAGLQIDKKEFEELFKKLVDLKTVSDAIDSFDFKKNFYGDM